ncbi:MAG: hypothetical protein HC780_18605 [Leptolyngbyaceae cyanobacterium CSU_1_3]|nr:hypothetical protein [Leptolyngbyaceae cyanobacterium CSU_1_3]
MLSHRLVIVVGAVVVVALGTIAPAQAATVTFSGTLRSLSDPGQITGYDSKNLANATFRGSYTFDPSTPNTFYSTRIDNYNPPPANLTPDQYPSGRYVQPVQKFMVQIGAATIDLPIGPETAFSRQFENSATDSLTVSNLVRGETGTGDGYRVFLAVADSTGQSLSSVSSDAESTSLPTWDRSYFQVFSPTSQCGAANCIFAEGILTSLVGHSSHPETSESEQSTTKFTAKFAPELLPLKHSLKTSGVSVPESTSIVALLGLGILGVTAFLKQRYSSI